MVYLRTLILCNFYSTHIIHKCGCKPCVECPWPTGILWFTQQLHFKEVQVIWNSVNQWLCHSCGLNTFDFHFKLWTSGNCNTIPSSSCMVLRVAQGHLFYRFLNPVCRHFVGPLGWGCNHHKTLHWSHATEKNSDSKHCRADGYCKHLACDKSVTWLMQNNNITTIWFSLKITLIKWKWILLFVGWDAAS